MCGGVAVKAETAQDSAARSPNSREVDRTLERRFARLRRGINTSHWFAQVSRKQGYTQAHFTGYNTAEDIRLIKRIGFDHIRLSVNLEPMLAPGKSGALDKAYLAYLDTALDMILKQNLAVIVDVHPDDDFKKRLATDDSHVETFTRIWSDLAMHFARRDPEQIFLEILNEPMIEEAARWATMQRNVAAAIRRSAPRHTIIATGHRWSSLKELLALEPLPDRNVIYNFHFYESHDFTHQGATWGAVWWRHFRNVPYPSSPQAIASLLPTIDDAAARDHLSRYGAEGWNSERVEREIGQAAEWAKRNKVLLTCNEFGVYRRFSPPEARARWIQDVRRALERKRIGWAMWDYKGGFSIVNQEGGRVVPDTLTVAALGLAVQ
jgi:aryl-phospho-beta-D-glucosidase BglC (GH1 family)